VKIKQEGSRGVVISTPRSGQMRMTVAEDGSMRMEMSKMKMEDFVGFLTPLVDRPVIDMTEL
jgi:uncharacterized protein (TIGR03435 family)